MAPKKESVNVIYSKDEKPEPIAIILKHPTIRKNIIFRLEEMDDDEIARLIEGRHNNEKLSTKE